MKIETFNYPLESSLREGVENLLDENFGLKPEASLERIEAHKNNYYSKPVKYILAFDKENLNRRLLPRNA